MSPAPGGRVLLLSFDRRRELLALTGQRLLQLRLQLRRAHLVIAARLGGALGEVPHGVAQLAQRFDRLGRAQ